MSIRARLLLGVALSITLVLLAAGFAVDRHFGEELSAGLDDTLARDADQIATGLALAFPEAQRHEATRLGLEADPEAPGGGTAAAQAVFRAFAEAHLELDPDAGAPAVAPRPSDPGLRVLLLDGRGTALPLAGEPLPGMAGMAAGGPAARVLRAADGTPWRARRFVLAGLRFADARWQSSFERIRGPSPLEAESATLVVARPRASIVEATGALRMTLLLIGAAGLLLGLLVAHVVVTRGTAPIERLRQRVARLGAASLRERVPSAGLSRELAGVADALNDALARLEASFGRERLIAASLAHELRTPLAELQSLSDLARRWPDDAEIQTELRTGSAAVAEHLGRIVDAILLLARLRAGAERLDADVLDPRAIVRSAVDRVSKAAAARDLEIDLSLRETPRAVAHAGLLEVLLGTLLENTVRHAPTNTRVHVATGASAGRALVTVSNEAPELDAADLDSLSEPFWRKDEARSGQSGGGLGLALAREICDALGTELGFALEEGRLAVRLLLPPAAP